MNLPTTIKQVKAVDQIFFSADWHQWHKNILKYCQRPFQTIEEMNEYLIQEHNKIVRPNDFVYYLGDLVFKNADINKLMNRLNGHWFLIRGNHDNNIGNNDKNFGWVKDRYELRVGNRYFVLDHYPLLSWDKQFHGSIQLHGHTHQKTQLTQPGKRQVHVGVDAWDFKPVHIDQIMDLVKDIR